MKPYKGRTVEIKRNFNMLALAQTDPEVKAWYGQAYRAVGPYYEHKAPGSGLSFEEQKLLLPLILGIESDDKDFRKAVTTFYHEFSTKVPQEGLKLQISLENDALPLSDTNRPLNVRDYLSYRHLLNHPDVAADAASAERIYNKKFYIQDPEGIAKEAIKINELEDKATVLYMKFKDDVVKMDQILTMLGINIKTMTQEDKVLKFKDMAKTDGRYNEFEQKEAFDRFIKTAEDKDLEYRYLVQEMIGAQYLVRVGNAIHFKESGEVIGQDMSQAVMYFKNPKNSRELNLMRAEYLLKVKKGEEYLPKEAREKTVTKEEVK